MSSRYQEQQGQHSGLPQERDERRGSTPPVEPDTSRPPVEPDTSRPPAPNREGPGPALPIGIILGIVVIFVLLFAVVLI